MSILQRATSFKSLLSVSVGALCVWVGLVLAVPSHAQQAVDTSGQPAQSAPPATQPTTGNMPDGVDRIIALQGDNSILLHGTRDGYEQSRDLVKLLTGEGSVVRTIVELSAPSTDQLKCIGVTVDPSTPSLSAADTAKLVAAWKDGRLSRAANPIRITTREDTPVDADFREKAGEIGTALTIVPRVARDGSTTVELLKPVAASCSAPDGGTSVVALAGRTTGSVRLLFITAKVVASRHRSTH
jgi:hypothetical protein